MTPTTATIVNALNWFTFKHVWNEVHSNYNVNIALTAVGTRFSVGYTSDANRLALPDATNQYAVYVTAHKYFNGGLPIVEDTWLSSVDVLNSTDVLIHVFPITGKVVSKHNTYFYKSSKSPKVYVAVRKQPLLKLTSLSNYKKLYLTVFRDSVLARKIYCDSFSIPARDDGYVIRSAVSDAINQAKVVNLDGTTVFVNGVEYDATSPITFTTGDFVDVICDTSVIGSFSVDLSTTDTGFFSTKDSCHKELVHIPKALNPNNYLITHDECTLFARSNVTGKGAYLHRAEVTSVSQVTHNDIAVATNVVDAFRTYLDTQDISIHVKIRTHNIELIRDRNFLEYLYLCDDNTIINHLRGVEDARLTFWLASALEQSLYIELMFQPPAFVTPSLIAKYVNGFGYYTVASILCRHLHEIQSDVAGYGHVVVTKPPIYRGHRTYPFVSLNGRKIQEQLVDFTDDGGNSIAVALHSNVYRPVGSTITIDLVANGNSQPYIKHIDASNTNFIVPFGDVVIYKEITHTTDIVGRGVVTNKSYQQLAPANGVLFVNQNSNSTHVICGPSLYGETIIIQNKTYHKQYLVSLEDQVTAGDVLQATLTTSCVDNEDVSVPLLGFSAMDCYLNGKYLIENLDYTAIPVCDSDNNIAIVQIIILNNMYLDTENFSNNVLEVIAHTSITLRQDFGFVVHDKIAIKNNLSMWYKGLSEAYIGGVLKTNVPDHGLYIDSTDTDNGTPFLIHSTLPHSLAIALSPYNTAIDDARIVLINDYFNRDYVDNTGIVIVPKSYTLYSPYLTAIIADVISGIIPSICDDPDDTLFVAQFSAYDYLRDRDPATNGALSARLDRRYVDVNVSYRPALVVGTATYRLIHRLARLVLAADLQTLGDVNDR